jgi:hypothetical protein
MHSNNLLWMPIGLNLFRIFAMLERCTLCSRGVPPRLSWRSRSQAQQELWPKAPTRSAAAQPRVAS